MRTKRTQKQQPMTREQAPVEAQALASALRNEAAIFESYARNADKGARFVLEAAEYERFLGQLAAIAGRIVTASIGAAR